MPAKLERIKDKPLRRSLAEAHRQLRTGDYAAVVRRAADAYVELLRRKPEMLQGAMSMRSIMFFPRLGARLIVDNDGAPTVVYDRQRFIFSEAVTYFEFAVDSLVREGI